MAEAGSEVRFYGLWFCPFTQRAWIGLLEKKVEFEYIEQKPYDKTPEWLAISPRGLVPCIVHNGESIYDSQVCLEYIDEAFPDGNQFLPKAPIQRARIREWCDHIIKKVVPPFYAMLLKHEEEEREQAKADLTQAILDLTSGMKDTGPYFLGDQFSMVDIMLIPHCIRIHQVLQHYRDFTIPTSPEFERYHKWYQAMTQRESVKKTTHDDASIQAQYLRYADNSVQSAVAEAIRRGKALP